MTGSRKSLKNLFGKSVIKSFEEAFEEALSGFQVFLKEQADGEKIDSLMVQAKNMNTPIILKIKNDKFKIYGDKKGDYGWQLTVLDKEISPEQKEFLANLPYKDTMIKYSHPSFNRQLIKIIKIGHELTSFPDREGVIRDYDAGILDQTKRINGLSHTQSKTLQESKSRSNSASESTTSNISSINSSDNSSSSSSTSSSSSSSSSTNVSHFFNHINPTPYSIYLDTRISLYLASYDHQGAFRSFTHAYYSEKLQTEKQIIIPGSIGDPQDGPQNRFYEDFLQHDGSLIRIEQFDIPSYRERGAEMNVQKPEQAGMPIARILTVSIIKPSHSVRPELLIHHIYPCDKKLSEKLFGQDPHLVTCDVKSLQEVQDLIDEITLPFKMYGALESYNYFGKNNAIRPAFFVADWKKLDCKNPNWIHSLDNWGNELFDKFNKIKWDHFYQFFILHQFRAHFGIAKHLLPSDDELPEITDEKITALKKLLDKLKPQKLTELDLDQLLKNEKDLILAEKQNITLEHTNIKNHIKQKKNFVCLQIAFARCHKDFEILNDLFKSILEKIILRKKREEDFLILTNKANELHLKCDRIKEKDSLCHMGVNLAKEILAIVSQVDNMLTIDEIANLLDLLKITTDLIDHLPRKGIDSDWSVSYLQSTLDAYKFYLEQFRGKYISQTKVPTVTAATGAGVTTVAGAGGMTAVGVAEGVVAVPAFIGGAAASTVAAVALPALAVVGGALLGYGLYKRNQTNKGTVYLAGFNMHAEAEKYLKALGLEEKKSAAVKKMSNS